MQLHFSVSPFPVIAGRNWLSQDRKTLWKSFTTFICVRSAVLRPSSKCKAFYVASLRCFLGDAKGQHWGILVCSSWPYMNH